MGFGFGTLASAFLIAAYSTYIYALRREFPNPVSITLWLIIIGLNTWTYTDFTDRQAALLPLCQLGLTSTMFAITVAVVVRHGWRRVKVATAFHPIDGLFAVIVLTGFLLKFLWQSSIAANWALQVALISSFFPYVKQAFRGQWKMNPWPWFLAVIAYAFQWLAALPNGLAALPFPTIGFFCHLVVGIGTLRPRPALEVPQFQRLQNPG
ncbi:MAG: hypothetical protein HYZ09_00205 [Candidatus Kerfeldbacteria bacterium]|nr:hypothetical protein [Candidatus Kerfeldbacteria bacterium]